MEARTVDASAPGAPAHGGPRPRRGLRTGGWLRGGGDGGDDLVEQLEAELALLREENARLAIRARSAADARPWDERIRALVPGGEPSAQAGERAMELLTECQLLRGALVEACRDVEAAMGEIRGRLEALAEPPLQQAVDEHEEDERAPRGGAMS